MHGNAHEMCKTTATVGGLRKVLCALLMITALLAGGSVAIAGLREECLSLPGMAVDDIGILTCTAAIRENDRDGDLYATRGYFYSFFHDYDRAFADFIKARELGTKDEKLDAMLGNAYLRKGEHDKAIELFDKVAQRDPKDVSAFIQRGDAYRLKGDLKRALADLNRSLENYAKSLEGRRDVDIDPDDDRPVSAHFTRGLVYSQMNEFDRAIADFSIAQGRIINDPKLRPLILSHRAEAYLRTGNSAQALSDADKSVELDASSAGYLELRARIREAMGQKTEAIQDYRRALSIDPKHKSSLEGLTRLGAAP